MERRERLAEVRQDDEKKTIFGVGAVYYDGTPDTEFQFSDRAVERIAPGAFDRAVRDDDVVGLFNHNPDAVLGRTSSGTMRLRSTERGLEYEIDRAETPDGEKVSTLIDRGDVAGSSFAFQVLSQEWSEESRDEQKISVRTIQDVRLFDTGPVVYPAYQATDTNVREARAELEAFRGTLPEEPVPEAFEDPEVDELEPAAIDEDGAARMAKCRVRLAEIASDAT